MNLGEKLITNLSYDAENRLVGVSGNAAAVMKYDGDGRRVKGVTLGGNSTTTRFVGNYYEDAGGTITKTYYAGASRVAVRSSSGVKYLFGNHLGSTSVSADGSGGNVTRQLYKPYGGTRFEWECADEVPVHWAIHLQRLRRDRAVVLRGKIF